jgi:hypothetical protein
MSAEVALKSYSNATFQLFQGGATYDVAWDVISLLSAVDGRYFVCLRDGNPHYEVSWDDWHRIRAAWHVRLEGSKLKDYTNEALLSPEI